MKVLVGCEESGTVRDAFAAKGHEAVSCDLKPTRSPGMHMQCDIFQAITSEHWDLIILHPDCTKVAVSGNRWYGKGMPLHNERLMACGWILDLWQCAKASMAKVALENPVGVLAPYIGKPSQYIHPWQFGHGETKKTCLWLHNLPPLVPTKIVSGRENRIWKMAPSDTRKRDRAVTYQGWADAMAEQWG